jgi:predicted amidohydrolase
MDETSRIRLGVVQAEGRIGDERARMLDDALRYVDEAGRRGVDLLVFPETYPGPTTHHTRYEVVEPLADAARRNGVALVAGTTEKAPGDDEAYYIASVVIDAGGEVLGAYRRTHPRGPYYRGLYATGPFWEFEYVAADELPVFDMGWGTLGVSICSEAFVPEIARSMALRGAEVCVFPTGALIQDIGAAENWQTLIRARAVENLMYTATTQNLFSRATLEAFCDGVVPAVDSATGLNTGHAMIASPERVLARQLGPGILTADLDLAYIRRIRRDPEFPDGIVIPPPYATLPGILNLHRPELTGTLAPQPSAAGRPG